MLKSILIGDSNIFNFFVSTHFQSLLFFRKFFFYFVRFTPKILLLFIEADVMMLLVFVQCLCIVSPCSFAIQIRMVALTCVFPEAPLTTFAQTPQSLGPLLSVRIFIKHLSWRSSELVQLFKRFNWFSAEQLKALRKINTKFQWYDSNRMF